MLIGNYSVLYRTPARLMGGLQGNDPAAFKTAGKLRGAYSAPSWDAKSSIPNGTRPPYSWLLPQQAGGLASILTGRGTLTARGALGRNIGATLTGSGSLTATGSLIVSAAATLTGSGTISSANLVGILQAAATITGSGSLAATATALGWMAANIEGSGDAEGTLTATGALAASILPYTELSPQGLAAAVWDALAVDSDRAGSMGEKVNDAGSASNPWTESIEGSYTAAGILRLLAAASLGKVSGADTDTITFTGIDGATHRIVATVDNGNRLALVLDPD